MCENHRSLGVESQVVSSLYQDAMSSKRYTPEKVSTEQLCLEIKLIKNIDIIKENVKKNVKKSLLTVLDNLSTESKNPSEKYMKKNDFFEALIAVINTHFFPETPLQKASSGWAKNRNMINKFLKIHLNEEEYNNRPDILLTPFEKQVKERHILEKASVEQIYLEIKLTKNIKIVKENVKKSLLTVLDNLSAEKENPSKKHMRQNDFFGALIAIINTHFFPETPLQKASFGWAENRNTINEFLKLHLNDEEYSNRPDILLTLFEKQVKERARKRKNRKSIAPLPEKPHVLSPEKSTQYSAITDLLNRKYLVQNYNQDKKDYDLLTEFAEEITPFLSETQKEYLQNCKDHASLARVCSYIVSNHVDFESYMKLPGFLRA